jgi:alanine racemase
MVFQDYTRFEGLFPCPDPDHGLYYSPMDVNGYSTWLEIDLEAIRNNVRQLHQITGNEVMAIVKANGYGHGATHAAKAAVEAGSAWCGVGRLEEAMSLRQAGMDCRILIMGFTPATGIPEAIAQNISVTVYDYEQAKQYAEQALAIGKPLSIHAKVDTGMGRLGIMAAEAPEFLRWLKKQKGLHIEGVFTHFARADEPQADLTEHQLERFFEVLEQVKQEGIRPEVIHAANSAGAIYFPDARFTLVRAGIALYGLDPSHEAILPSGFRPALTWKALLTSVKVFPPGHGISYGSIYTTKQNERIGTIPAGYADGFRRVSGQQVLVGGKRVPVVGKVCMDQSAILLEDVPDARVGDEVVLLGRQGEERISAEEIGDRWGTVNYEVVCGLANRLPRLYL